MLDTKLQSEEFKFYFLFFLALTFIYAMLMPFSYGDFAVWIAEGQQIVRQGTVYIKDVYSFNPTSSLPYPWLSCLFYYLIDSNFATEAIFFMHRIIPVGIVAFWLVRYPALLHKKNLLTLMICITGLRMLIIDRPALLVFPLIPYFYELIESQRIYKQKLKSLLILILWTNLHGSFMFFLLLLGYSIFNEFIRKRKFRILKEKLLFFASAVAVTCINPWGPKIYQYVYQTAAISKMRITEWQALSFYDEGKISSDFVIYMAALILLASIVIYKKKISVLLTSILPVFLITSALAVRNLPLLFSVFPLFWGKHLVNLEDISGFKKRALVSQVIFNRAILLSMVFFGFFLFATTSENIRNSISAKYATKYDDTSSFRIAAYLDQSSGKRILNSWILGSFLIYSQSNQIFIDTRNIIYSDDTYSDYVHMMNNTDGKAEVLLNIHRIDYVVVEKAKALVAALQASQNWTFIMEDNGYELFQRK